MYFVVGVLLVLLVCLVWLLVSVQVFAVGIFVVIVGLGGVGIGVVCLGDRSVCGAGCIDCLVAWHGVAWRSMA